MRAPSADGVAYLRGLRATIKISLRGDGARTSRALGSLPSSGNNLYCTIKFVRAGKIECLLYGSAASHFDPRVCARRVATFAEVGWRKGPTRSPKKDGRSREY